MLATLAFAFLAGVLSLLSPCVLPLLPIVLGAAASRHKLGPLALSAIGPSRCRDAAAPKTIGSNGRTQGDSSERTPARNAKASVASIGRAQIDLLS